ncbi:MAG TPA: anti-sigma factor [Gemmatimonadaceae bacterium]|nr:anti-sigma factor [Gemmatimonadaceae bacterium]
MTCADCRELLNAYLDGELLSDERARVAQHLSTCAECEGEHDLLGATSHRIQEGLVRHTAPDVLKARIRSALAKPDAYTPPEPAAARRGPRWPGLAAAGLVVALASSAVTFGIVQHRGSDALEHEMLASHIRSLMPGHLTDVVSSNQHNVKPWFNGRVDASPAVPQLDSAGFPLVGGRLDYVQDRSVAVIVYARRAHMINVYSWPIDSRESTTPRVTTEHGYHLAEWRGAGFEFWAVSDVGVSELEQFIAAFRRAQ